MANTNVKAPRTPRQPRQPKATAPVAEPEVENVVETPESVQEQEEIQTPTPEVVENENTPVVPEPEVEPEPLPEPEPEKEPEPEVVTSPENRTTIYLQHVGEKYNVLRGFKRLNRVLVGLEKAKLIASAYGENNPTIVG